MSASSPPCSTPATCSPTSTEPRSWAGPAVAARRPTARDRPEDRAAPRRPVLRGRPAPDLGRPSRDRDGWRWSPRSRSSASGAAGAGSRSATAVARWCRRCRGATTSSRSTASPTASPATTPASCGPRPPRSSSASTSPADDVVEAGRPARGRRGDEDGDRRGRARSPGGCATSSSPATCRSTPARRCSASSRSREAERGRGASDPVDLRAPGPRRAGRPSENAASCDCVEAFVLGFDVEPRPRLARRGRRGVPELGSAGPRSWRSSTRSPTSWPVAPSVATPTTTTIRGPARATSTPTSARSTSSARACRSGSVIGCRRAVAHYGVTDLDAGPGARGGAAADLPRRSSAATQQLGVVTALLDGCSTAGRRAAAADELRETLDRLIDATRRRFPGGRQPAPHRALPALRPPAHRPGPGRGVGHDARPRRRPGRADLESGRLRRARRRPAAAAADPGRGGHPRRHDGPCPLLEVLTRRYYKIRELGPMTPVGADGVVRTSYRHRGRRGPRRSPSGPRRATLPRAVARAAAARRRSARSDTAVVDLYLPLPATAPATTDELADELAAALADVEPARRRSGASPWSRHIPARRATCSRSGGSTTSASDRSGWRPGRGAASGRRAASRRTSSSAGCTR